MKGAEAHDFNMTVSAHNSRRRLGKFGVEMGPHMLNMIVPIYCHHFDNCNRALHSLGHGDTTKWSHTLDFARIVRNAASHGGKLEWRQTKSGKPYRKLGWYGLNYGPSDDGRHILGTDLYFPDLFVLLLEMDEELFTLTGTR
jgi:hypothetical protein